MSGDLECAQSTAALTIRHVQLARAVSGEVGVDDTGDLITVRLCGDCDRSVSPRHSLQTTQHLHGFHFSPASSNALSAIDRWVVLLPIVFASPFVELYSDAPSRFSSIDSDPLGLANGSILCAAICLGGSANSVD